MMINEAVLSMMSLAVSFLVAKTALLPAFLVVTRLVTVLGVFLEVSFLVFLGVFLSSPFLSSLEFVPFVAVEVLGVVVFPLLVGFLASLALELLLVMGLGCSFFVFVALDIMSLLEVSMRRFLESFLALLAILPVTLCILLIVVTFMEFPSFFESSLLSTFTRTSFFL